MFTHFFKIAARRFARPNLFSVVNILGLTLGTACALYMLLFVWKQYQVDRHHTEGTLVYRVVTDVRQTNDELWQTATSSPPIAPAMELDFPEVELATRMVAGWGQMILRHGENTHFMNKGYYVDSSFFDVFTYDFIEGNAATAARLPYTMVLTKHTASLLFGEQSALGKEITLENGSGKALFKVTGVVDEASYGSHIRGNFYLAMNSGDIGEYVLNNQNWSGNNFIYSYVKLQDRSNPDLLEAKFPDFLMAHAAEQFKDNPLAKTLHLEPLQEIHIYSDREHQVDTTVKARFMFILLSIAVLIQLIACINFMNLTTARASRRGKEVGVRKVVGARRSSLAGQFLTESLFMALIAVGLAVPLLNIALPHLNTWTGATVDFSILKQGSGWGLMLGLALVTGLLAGSYPAFYQSGFRPLEVLKGHFGNRGSALILRRGLVVFQFVVSIGLLVAVLVIDGQVRYIESKDLGFSSDHKLLIPLRTPEARQALPALRSELERLPQAGVVTGMANYPGEFVPYDFHVYLPGKDPSSSVNTSFSFIDQHYLSAFDIPLQAGRNFTSTDTVDQIIVNETLLQALNIPAGEAIGQRIFSQRENGEESYQIVGLMRDYHIESLYEPMAPFMLFYESPESDRLSHLAMSFKGENYQDLVGEVQTKWEAILPNIPFDYSFLDENLLKQYEGDFTLLGIIRGFTGMALFISCLGLLGLSVFNAEQRIKEIGIRKVLGASVGGIMTLLSREFLLLVGLAAIPAIPLAWWGMNRWLETFTYRIALEWWMFAAAIMLVLLIALLTVAGNAFRAALRNPVEALRYE